MPVKRVYKYDLPLRDVVRVAMPAGAIVLHVGVQHDEPFVWALVDPDPDAARVDRAFRIAGTGHDIDGSENMVHIGTFQMRGGALVFHVFDLGERKPSDGTTQDGVQGRN